MGEDLAGATGTETAAVSPAMHFASFDGMRGMLALLVMLFHYGLSALIARGTHGVVHDAAYGLCVDFFFVLSGFVLMHSYGGGGTHPGIFFARRVMRLAPAYVVVLLATVAILRPLPPVWAMVANLLLVDDIGRIGVIVPPSWSVPYELYLPLIAVAFARWIPRVGPRTVIGLALAAVLLGSLVVIPVAEGRNWHLARAALGLATGALLYRARPHLRWQPPEWLAPGAFVLSIVAMTLAGTTIVAQLAFYPCVAAAILGGVKADRWLANRLTRFLGDVSFPLYLVHFLVMDTALAIFGKAQASGSLAIKGSWVLVSFALAWAIHRWIEMPGNDWGRRYFRRGA